MQLDEPFDETIKSSDISHEMEFRLATEKDIPFITILMLQRNPSFEESSLLSLINNEVKVYNDGVNYGVFVACLNSFVVGFCRYYNSESVPPEKIKFKSDSGFYGAGIIVHKDYRRKGVASFLSKNREIWLRRIGAKGIYSCVAVSNKASQKMHEKFGFEFLRKVDGVFTQSFLPNDGMLYYKKFYTNS